MAPYFSFIVLLCAFVSLLTGTGAAAVGTATKPTVILIPAAFSKATVYDKVKHKLSNTGYDIVAVDLPSVGRGASKVDRTPEIEAVQKVLSRRIHQGKDIVLVGNSYGATVICDAVKDFEDKSAMKYPSSSNGKILGLIFFSGFIPYISELSGAGPDIRHISPSWFRFESTKRVFWDNDIKNHPPQFTLYNLLPSSEARTYSGSLQPSSFAALNATATYIPYDGKFRTLYFIGKYDNTVPSALAESYLVQPGAKWENVTIDGDHSPMLSRPNEFVNIVRRFSREKA
ncbi:Alpha/Beta hydrolase protein [Ampelomyces quisqualis]|uniref:Alpha/Beta hydrolase protein n=1 Tax=Ampelomyces quisqualis TaxID=50730 RepID=A0A6A5R037_AMPQU|nr:Alpha/Beta hydrolase protein [Ampelomyces quisqualis]